MNIALNVPAMLWACIITPNIENPWDLKAEALEKLPEKDLQSSIQIAMKLSLTCKRLNKIVSKYLSLLKVEYEDRKLIPLEWSNCKLNMVYLFCEKNQIKNNSQWVEDYVNNPQICERGFPKDNDRLGIINLLKEYGPQMQELRLVNSSVKTLSSCMFYFSNIIQIYMPMNNITSIKFIEKFTNLRTADFRNNKIEEIIISHSKIEDLYLSGNCIAEIPENLQSLFPNLDLIYLSENRLKYLNFKHNKLKKINASRNQLEIVILKCRFLEELYIEENSGKINKIDVEADNVIVLNLQK